jgi:hypothetical protein
MEAIPEHFHSGNRHRPNGGNSLDLSLVRYSFQERVRAEARSASGTTPYVHSIWLPSFELQLRSSPTRSTGTNL